MARGLRNTLVLIAILALFSIARPFESDAVPAYFATIGSGQYTDGEYFIAGKAISDVVTANKLEHGVRVYCETTGGSVFNIQQMSLKYMDFGITDSKLLYQAYSGSPEFEWSIDPVVELRSVFNLHTIPAIFATSTEVPDNVVYTVVKEVFENFEAFKNQHISLKGLSKADMVKGMSVPVHPGALKYYTEKGFSVSVSSPDPIEPDPAPVLPEPEPTPPPASATIWQMPWVALLLSSN